MNILTVSKWEFPGGAETSAYNLFQEYRQLGHQSWLTVGTKRTDNSDIFEIPRWKWPSSLSKYLRAWRDQNTRKNTLAHRFVGYASVLPVLPHYINQIRGHEDFFYPGTDRILGQLPAKPDIIHCHNLHINYFDIRVLPYLSKQASLIINMRDAWWLTGHCAYSGECERWKKGCGNCPDLARHVSIAKDASAYNHRVKMRAVSRTKYHLTAPSQWLLDQSNDSALGKYALSKRVVPNGIDTSVFYPVNQNAARKHIGLDTNARIVLFTGHHGYKDIATMSSALGLLSAPSSKKPYLFLCIGKQGESQTLGHGSLRYLGFISNPSLLRAYYAAADVYLHAAEGEAFGKTITEAMACGTPVVVTATGGVPEQVIHGRVGFIAEHKDALGLAYYMGKLLQDTGLRLKMGTAAAEHVERRYTIKRQVKQFVDWYAEILQQ